MKKSFYTVGSLVILLIAAFVFVLVPVLAGRNPGANIPAFGKYEGTEIRYGDSDFDNYLSNYAEYIKKENTDLELIEMIEMFICVENNILNLESLNNYVL